MFEAGQSIGSYRVLNKIGTGGMGAVYLAEHPLIGKKVALKVIHRELASNKEVVQRFFQEAKAVTRIGNEHIVEIHDFGQTPEGDHFYIMEYLEGQTLAQVLTRDRVLDVLRALHIAAQIAAALSAAHAQGVVHRDLKPDNIMLTPRLGDPDFVVLLDFGLAKMFQAGGQSAVKTAAGVLLGTPQYMSPEACESRSTLDHRTDIYALGVLMFQMMTGMLPFDGETMGEVLVKQVTQLPPPPRGFNPSIPPAVEQIVLRCLAKTPNARFPTMQALREALLDPESYLQNQPPIAPARSIAPGEMKIDAKTVMAYAAAEQVAKHRTGALQVIPPGQKSAVQTAAATVLLDSSNSSIPRQPPPELLAPNMPKMNTMRIATPAGYSARPPRKMWPFVLVAALLLGLGGGAFAVAWFGRKKAAATGADATAAGSASQAMGSGSAKQGEQARPPQNVPPPQNPPTPRPIDAGAAGSAAPAAVEVSPGSGGSAAAAQTAVIVIDSVPPGAEVFGSDKKSYGKTPARMTLPISDMPMQFELQLAGYKKKTKQLVVSGNTVVQVTLDPAPTAPHGAGSSSSKGSGSKGKGSGGKHGSSTGCSTCLERPD